jgi:two-component system OmpR family sensor kinase/two-component system sensor histidine kinase BaeS
MMRSLWLKLMGAFLLVVLVGGGIDAFLVSRSTQTQFSQYINQNGRALAQQLAPTLARYYSRQGSWQGVESLLNNPWGNMMINDGMGMMWEENGGMWQDEDGMGMGGDMGMDSTSNPWSMMGLRLLLADAQGTIIADSAAQDVGKTVSPTNLAAGVPVVAGNQQVGTLLPLYAETNTPNAAGDFVSAVNRSTWLAGIITAVVALLLGSILFFQIISPVQKLTAAAQKIAAGDLGQRIPTQSQDEIGTLATAFNQMADSLAQHEELRRNLIADVAHELRTPLTVIQSNLEAMLDGVLPASPQEIATLRDEAALLTRLVADLRLLSLAESGQLKLERVRTNITELIAHAVEPFRLQAQSGAVGLNLELASNLPQVEVDVDRMTQVIRNLLSNALRHTLEGGQVTVTCKRATSQQLLITVSDTGEGISSDDLPYVFDRFYRADKSRSRTSGGSGIGLAIVKQLVEAHGGKVWVESQPHRGTTFGFTLPS